jgi:SsrA-binding protein
LLKPDEIAQVLGAETADGLTVVPISVYNKGRNLKLELAIVRGKKNRDKRETIKKTRHQTRYRSSLEKSVNTL